MTLLRHLLALSSFLVASFFQFNGVLASEIPGYIGQQSFNLSDDSQLRDFDRRAQDAKIELARIDEARSQLSDQLRSLQSQRESLLSRMSETQKSIDGTMATKESLLKKQKELEADAETNKDQIAQLKIDIENCDKRVGDLSKQYGANKLELAPVNVRIDQLSHDLERATTNSDRARAQLQSLARDRENFRQDLINALSMINREGANKAQVDGRNDGAALARDLGQSRGQRDGEEDGYGQGTTEGQARYYRKGADQGERDGAARARFEGERDGANEGYTEGNRSAANREGSAAGIKRGDASNAASVGESQGKLAGMQRAERTGSIDGNNIGESEVVKKFESDNLQETTVAGPFAGSFSMSSPDYPGDFNGRSFNPNVYNSRELLRKAYADGYLDQYRVYTRYEFLNRIDSEYNTVYDARYADLYNQAVSKEYPDFYNRGRADADARAYSRDYPIIKSKAYQVAFDQADSSPSRNSSIFTETYKSAELSAYNNRFEDIRSAVFQSVEAKIFAANIAALTEKYRLKRVDEVTTVYSNNAVLEFVSSEMLDGGINGVAKLDGVFQPGETTLHSIVLKNYGLKAAQNVSVVLNNGEVVKLPSIPAKSKVTVKGAGISQIDQGARIGATVNSKLRVLSTLSSNDVVEAAHFDSIGNGILKNADLKSVRVQYPLSLANLNLSAPLLKGVSNKLNIVVNNNSKRAYNSDLKVDLLINSQSPILQKAFSLLTNLQTSAQLSDAEILIAEDADIYRDLDFSAVVSQNGVKLGELTNHLQAMAKAPYTDKKNNAVLVANSDKNLNQLLDALSLLGGSEKVSVLDLSLASQNATILTNGLTQKVMLVLDDEKGSNTTTLNSLMTKSKLSTFVFVDNFNVGLKTALSLAASKDAQKLLWDKRVVMFTNPYRADKVEKSSAMIQSSMANFMKDLPLASDLTLSATDLLQKFKNEVNKVTYFSPQNAIKMYSLKTMAEIMCINRAYDASGNIFTRNKKWAEMIGSDNTLFINVLKGASAGEVTEAKLSFVLPAIALKDTVSNAMSNAEGIYRNMMPKILNATNKVLSNMDDDYKKSLKNNFKDLYNKVYDQAQIHRPFYIDPPRNTTNF